MTAFEHYAIQAIRNSVFDYIMKPVRQEELFSAITASGPKRQGENQNLAELIEVLKGNGTGKVKLNTRTGYILSIQMKWSIARQMEIIHIFSFQAGIAKSLPRTWEPLKIF